MPYCKAYQEQWHGNFDLLNAGAKNAAIAGIAGRYISIAGVYIDSTNRSRVQFRWVKAPSNEDLTRLTHTIAHRVARYLERQGLLVRDAGNSYLTADGVDADPESPMNQLLGS